MPTASKAAAKKAAGKATKAVKAIKEPAKKTAAKPAAGKGKATAKVKAAAKRATTTKAAPTKPAAATKAAKPVAAAKPAAIKATKATKAVKPETKAAAAKPAKAVKKSPRNDAFLESQRKLLLEEREAYTRSADALRAEAEQLAAEREPGDVQFDEESGEGDTMNVERERDLALSAQALQAVEDIDKALVRIAAGTYGICERCGEPIPRERLRALPYAALCVKCKSGGLSRR